ncbi:hypothetical protein LTS18_014159 [Coniosporium uncinatum]|uniref:Uncharacterized protein n=1 Tax=Coniosporium uncinatum TaxID=93489 RepID=A0ACC3CW52_9PEZI|nr:hypothetical protein LTS18_014159 [Coniosporium uncinatum]
MAHSINYHTLRVPKETAHVNYLASKFRTLRLHALQTSPNSFAAAYADEVTLPLLAWTRRLEQTGKEIFICKATPMNRSPTANDNDGDLDLLLLGEWIGMFTLCGPTPLSGFYLPLSGHTPGPEASETRWHMTALYTSPAHRGRGLAKKLIDASMRFARDYSGSLGPEVRTRLRLVVHPNNVVVKGLYGGLGFEDAGRCTLLEAYVASGEGKLVPVEGERDPGKWDDRIGVCMECLI